MTYPPLAEMVGQLFIVGFKGCEIDESHPVYADIARRNLGGVILFDRHLASRDSTNNIVGAQQLARLSSDLQSIRAEQLLIAVDQEGGRVNRFRGEFGFPLFPEAAELGKKDSAQTEERAGQLAAMLKKYGINYNLAPVVDLNSNPDNPIIGRFGRSFSADPHRVSAQAAVWIRAHRKAGIVTCLKHFPGHGSAAEDSHTDFVDISKSWHDNELAPYQELINNNQADSIMLGHLFHKDFDPVFPASLSAKTVSFLRKELNFHGPVVTDDLQMRAVTDRYGLQEAVILALQAEVDLILIGNNLQYDSKIFSQIHKMVLDAIDKGRLAVEQIASSWRRVQTLKASLSASERQNPSHREKSV